MKIVNIREGFATNSSSTHSIILKDGKYVTDYIKDIDPFNFRDYSDTDYGGYGWEDFLLTTPESKLSYLAAQMKHYFERSFGINYGEYLVDIKFIKSLVEGLTGAIFTDNEFEDLHVDHQSIWLLPKGLPYAFFEELKEFVLNPNVIIAGGNDNGDNNPYTMTSKDIDYSGYLCEDRHYYTKCKKDGDYWTFLSDIYGTKIKFSFNRNIENDILKSKTPDLVDMKITNKCNSYCSFCYMNSDKDGKHAQMSSISNILYVLRQLNVLEVALGGGEPTLHPDFDEILKTCRIYNIVPNFSTHSTDWLLNDDIMYSIFKYVGGIGVSLHGTYDIDTIYNYIYNNLSLYFKKMELRDKTHKMVHIMGQYIFGSANKQYTREFIDECSKRRIPLLLLGPKYCGKGHVLKKQEPFDDEWVIKLISDYHGYLSVDTQFAKIYKNCLEELNIPNISYMTREGLNSCYIDAVELKMGMSSYVDDYTSIEKNTYNVISEEFKKY